MSPRLPVLLALTLGLSSSAFELRRDSQGEIVHWGPRVDFVLDAHLAIQLKEARADAAVKAAVAALDEATPGCDVSVHVGTHGAVGYVQGQANQNDIFALSDWPYDEKALAATVITVNTKTHEIIDADIVFNVDDHHFRVVDQMGNGDDQADVDDVQNTITHELGHALGLMHNDADVAVVMYPSAPPMEISKRVLAGDDREGLATLYLTAVAPVAPVTQVLPGFGCSSTGSSSSGVALFAAFALLALRRRRALAVVAIAAPLAVFAAPPADRELPDVAKADRVAVAQVVSRTSGRVPGSPGLLMTDLRLLVSDCVKGDCESSTVVVRLPGGRLGDFEQVVAHQPVPELKEQVVVVQATRTTTLFRLADAVHRARVVNALTRAHLRVPVSVVTQTSAPPPAESR